MNPLEIPEILTEIFLNLNGGHLHRCHQVCKDWNEFIKAMCDGRTTQTLESLRN